MKRLAVILSAAFLTLLLSGSAAASAAQQEPIIDQTCILVLCVGAPVPVPTVTVSVPGPTHTVVIPGPTRAIPGPTVTQVVPGSTKTIYQPGPIRTVSIPGPTVTKTVQAVPTGQPTPRSANIGPSPKTVTVTKPVTRIRVHSEQVVQYVRLTRLQAVGVSLLLLLIGALVTVGCMVLVYRIGQKEGEEKGARRSLLEVRRMLRKETE